VHNVSWKDSTKNIKYSTTFLALPAGHKVLQPLGYFATSEDAVPSANEMVNSCRLVGLLIKKNVASLLNGPPHHKPLRCQNVGYIMTVSHERVVRGTTFHAPAYTNLRKQFIARSVCKAREENQEILN
jgi:hypothetical protein